MSHRFINNKSLRAISAAAISAAVIVGIVTYTHSPQPSAPPVEVGDQASEDPASPSEPSSNSPPGELYGVDADPDQLLEASRFG